jgi:protein-tyrosine phosphatase
MPKSLQNTIDWIEIEWIDYQPSTLNKEQWLNIIELFRCRKQNVVIYCTGGHGRTGTALAILAYLTQVIPKYDDPVKWIRDHYCEECVETKSQISYIEEITGARVFQTATHDNYCSNRYGKAGIQYV